MLAGRCPNCGEEVTAKDLGSAPHFPFCDRRCRMADLDRWFTEDYRIAGSAAEANGPERN